MKVKKDLTCAHCGSVIPETHRVYRYRAEYSAAIEGRAVFCNRGHGLMYRHANTDIGERAAQSRRSQKEVVPRDLTCTYCDDPLPEDHKAYKQLGRYKKVKAGVKKAFCCPSHATLYSNANRDQEFRKKISKAKRKPIPAYDLTCTHCNEPLPIDHKIYKRVGSYLEVKNGIRNVFCCLNHSRLHQHSSMTEEEKQKRSNQIRQTKENKTPEEKERWRNNIRKVHAAFSPEKKEAIRKKKQLTSEKNNSVAARHETKKRIGSYKQSKPEFFILHKLRSLLPHVDHQHRLREGYPYAADFYDSVSDTIFEYQGYFSHGTEPYDPNRKDHRLVVRQLQKQSGWAAKLTLKIWTEDDPAKRLAASKSNLNYVEWFNLEQFESWYLNFATARLGADKRLGYAYKFGSKVICAHHDKNHNRLLTKYPDLVTYYPWEDLNRVATLVKAKEVLYARKLEVREVPTNVADSFCAKYHIQGSCKGTKLAIALIQENTIVGVMTFGKPRYRKNYDYELLRLCYSKAVVGGTSRMWKRALSCLKDSSIVSYCDLSKFSGSIYTDLGFKPLGPSRPSTHWYNPYTGQHITDNLLRQRGFDQLVGQKLGRTYGKGSDNVNLMYEHGFKPIKDRGQKTFVYNPLKEQ